ncbi:hypothetical protein K1719_009082 [Acacia pycnantha]|nr:hypothetical protein K1719_009082 [Acacia pycnantha]
MSNLMFQYFFFLLVYFPRINLGDTCLRPRHGALYIFGDSGYDAGNTTNINGSLSSFRANHWPYGQTTFNIPSGRFSDGRFVPDFIGIGLENSAEFAKLPLIQPYLFPGNHEYIGGINFASGGTGALFETNQGRVIDLKTQLSYFKRVIKVLRQEQGDAETKSLVARAVYFISIGSNDYLGGRKFGFVNLGPLGCTPFVRALVKGSEDLCREEVSALVKLHNTVLSVEIQKLEKQLKGFKYSLLNFYDVGFDVISLPSKYGFKEASEACCGSGPYRGYNLFFFAIYRGYNCGGKGYELCKNTSEYVFFDAVHPTERAYEIFSQFIWNGNHTITGPYNLKALFQL